jgi:hypothetical protein
MSIGEAIVKGFTVSGKMMKVIVVFFVFNVIIGLLSLPLTDPLNADNPGIIAISAIASILFFLMFIYLQGGALGLVRDQIKTGESNFAKFTEYGKNYYTRILGLLLLYIAIAVGVVLVLALLSAGLLLLGDNIVVRSIVAVIVTIVSVIVITGLLFPIYVVVAEETGPIQSLKKGVAIAKDNFFKTIGIFLAMLAVSLVISLIVGFIAGIVTIPMGETLSRIVLSIVNSAVQSFIPIVMMITFLSYYMGLAETKGTPASTVGPESTVV